MPPRVGYRTPPRQGRIRVAPAEAVHLELGDRVGQGTRLVINGRQTLRAIFLDAWGPIADHRINGSGALAVPAHSRAAILIGQGTGAVPGLPGIDPDTLLLALGRRSFAAPGCVLTVAAGELPALAPLDEVTGREALDHASNLRLRLPTTPNGSLVLALSTNRADPEPLDQAVYWHATNTVLSLHRVIAGSERTALVIAVQARGRFELELDLAPGWCLESVALSQQAAHIVADDLSAHPDWDLVDDDRPQAGGPATRITLETPR